MYKKDFSIGKVIPFIISYDHPGREKNTSSQYFFFPFSCVILTCSTPQSQRLFFSSPEGLYIIQSPCEAPLAPSGTNNSLRAALEDRHQAEVSTPHPPLDYPSSETRGKKNSDPIIICSHAGLPPGKADQVCIKCPLAGGICTRAMVKDSWSVIRAS